ncbi:hypothetical protein K1T71_012505 [Dendrolimus kikuchii]|uniref:Uncharacterized protein n=1 Tax=Dendrolimus kikuchii TaxID=765133 RepID=A0ACC1CJW6_9NEOP|nr:hypothetical protein K1T71_012505 [Dendrolimus kikuchii]
MKSVIIIICIITTCYCAVEFNERPRNFSIELLYYTQLETDGHVVISPFGIWTLMTGMALGANRNSYNQITKAFRLPKDQNTLIKGYKDLVNAVHESATDGVTLMSKNFVFLDNDFTINPAFRSIVQKDFGAMLQELDFDDPKSANRANKFIQNTGAQVSNVLRSDDFTNSRMILTNVITFRGLWNSPFNVTDTLEEPFYNENKQVIGSVKMMYQKGLFPFSNVKNLKAFALELPYGTSGKYSMLVILPHPNTKLNDMYMKLAEVTLKDIFEKLQLDLDLFGLEEIDVKLPRFKISTNVVMNKPLNYMGVTDVFQPNLANFDRLTKENIFVSAVVHKAEIEVTEVGTVATAISTATFADRISSPAFYANRPFLYFVIEKSTLTPMFGGIYSKPSMF